MQDYGIRVCGCLDLRHLMKQNGILSHGGLASMAQNLLGIKLDKNWRIRCSDWEASALSAHQVQYASQDALVAVDIFSKLVQHELSPIQPKWSRIVELCQSCVDVKYKDKSKRGQNAHAKLQDGRVRPTQQASSRTMKMSSRAFSTRQKPLYDNCILQAPDGEVLSTCDHRKAEWWVTSLLYEGHLGSKNRFAHTTSRGQHFSIQRIVQTWPQMIFTCSQQWRNFLGGRYFKSNEEVKDAVKQWLNGPAAEVYDGGKQKLVTPYDECLNVAGDYVEL